MSTKAETALKAAKNGLYVFPCANDDKIPATWDQRMIKWPKVATKKPDEVRAWWDKLPDANIGIACKPSKLLVVDCDMNKGHPLPKTFANETGINNGDDLFYMMVEMLGERFPHDTLTVSTPSGGRHYYFRNPDDVKLTNAPLAAGWVDIRANGGSDGGYVLAPPSRTSKGSYAVSTPTGIATAPPWLLDLCKAKVYTQPEATQYAQPSTGNHAKLLDVVTYAHEGNRNNALHWAACSLAEEGMPIAEAESMLVEAAKSHPDMSEWEIRRTTQSAYRTVGK